MTESNRGTDMCKFWYRTVIHLSVDGAVLRTGGLRDIFESHVPCLPRLNQYTGHRAGVTRRRDGKVGDSGAERAAAVQL